MNGQPTGKFLSAMPAYGKTLTTIPQWEYTQMSGSGGHA